MTDDQSEHRCAPRREMEPDEATLSFIVDEDELEVTSVNISDTGLGFSTSRPLKVRLALTYPDREESREATLVWVSSGGEGEMNYGFHFNKEETT